jgi:hypothetical protein
MTTKDFAGLNNFTWWIGVVEDRKDPLKLNRSRVRIQGWHADNISELPTEHLPWASILVSPSTSRATAGPKENDWVQGFFMDGDSAQYPVIFGVLPGINTKVVEVVGAPKPPVGVVGDVAGEPSTARIARGVMEGTIVNKNNKDLAHVCDFISEMQKNINLKKYTKALANEIREIIRKVMKALGFSDATGQFSWILNTLKAYARELKRIQKEIIQPIIDFEKYVLAYITKIRGMITWLLNLPERFLKMLDDCYQRLLKLIKQILVDTVKGFGEDLDTQEALLAINDVMTAVDETYKTLELASTAVAGAQVVLTVATTGLLVPVNASEVESANTYINSYTTSGNNIVSSVTAGLQAP